MDRVSGGDRLAGKGRLQMNPECAVGAGETLCSWESLRDGEGAEPPGPGAGATARVPGHGSHLCLLLQGPCSEPSQTSSGGS